MLDGGHTQEAYSIHHKLLKESSKLAYDKGILCALKSLMWYHGVNKAPNLDSVLHYGDLFETKIAIEDIQQNTELIESLELPQYYLNKGQLLATRLGLPEQGLENYFKAYPLIPKDDMQTSIAYNIHISEIYFYKFQYDKALEVLEPLLQDTTGIKPYLKIKLLNSIAVNYTKKEIPEKSYLLHKEVLKIAKKTKDIKSIWWTKNQLTHDYFRLGEHQKAIDSALVVRHYCIKNNIHSILYNNTSFLSTYYHAVGDIDKAIAYRKEAVNFSKGVRFTMGTYSRLAEYYTEKKQYQKAIDAYKKRNIAVDSLRSTEKKTLTNLSLIHI